MKPFFLALAFALAAACPAAPDEATDRPTPELAESAGAELAERLARHRRRLRSTSKDERQKAYDAFLREGDEGRRLLRDALLPIRKELAGQCRAFRLTEAAQKKMLKAHKALDAARKEALRVIFDRNIYPDANHGRSGQPIVDKAVGRVKAIYPPYQQLFGPPLKRFARVARAYGRILEIDAQLLLCNAKLLRELKPPLQTLLPGIGPELVAILFREAEFRDYCARCLRYNRAVRTSTKANERKVVELTNEYRMPLGVRPLAINERLVQAARKHSAEMAALGYFGHTSPKPERRTASQRCRLEGYDYFGGENCAYGVGAAGAFGGWYNSSGHHRNMLNPRNNEIGVGHAGPWTEDFGRRPTLDLDHPPRRQGNEPPKREPKPKKKPFPWDEFFRM